MPTPWGDFTCYVYESILDGEQHVAFVRERCRARTTCWCGSTPSASPATSSTRCAATAGSSCTPRWS
ncbi:MAG: hypothetical protein R2716_03830 [Microthrixaceae bacterium]